MIQLHNKSQVEDVRMRQLLSAGEAYIYPNEMRKSGHFTPTKCANTPTKCAKVAILPQRNAQTPQRNAQTILITAYKTACYHVFKKQEIIYKLLRNNLVILEIEKLPSKILGFLRSFPLAGGSKVGYVMVMFQSKIINTDNYEYNRKATEANSPICR